MRTGSLDRDRYSGTWGQVPETGRETTNREADLISKQNSELKIQNPSFVLLPLSGNQNLKVSERVRGRNKGMVQKRVIRPEVERWRVALCK